jgi:hypothetical protein
VARQCGRDQIHGLEAIFEDLAGWDYSVVPDNPETHIDFNCIAWAAGDRENCWWPGAYWPQGVTGEETIEAFVLAYGTLGYQRCDDESLEPDHDKIALYTHDGRPLHAARQLDELCWSSKLGQDEILCHPLRAIEGRLYGKATVFLHRRRSGGQLDPVRELGCPAAQGA